MVIVEPRHLLNRADHHAKLLPAHGRKLVDLVADVAVKRKRYRFTRAARYLDRRAGRRYRR